MKTVKTLLKPWSILAVMLVVAMTIYSCDGDDEPCTPTTWYQDIDGDGLGNPDVSQSSCEQPDGYVANPDDPEDCITTTYYRDADFDGMGDPGNTIESCTQPDGYVTNADDDNDTPAATIVLFEGFETISGPSDNWGDVINANGKFRNYASLNGDAAISAPEGSNYMSYIVADTEENGQGRMQVIFGDDETIDISGFNFPHLNVYLHSGSDAANIMGFDLDIRDSERQAIRDGEDPATTISTFFTWEQDHGDPDLDSDVNTYVSLANSGVIDNNTGGAWKLYSIPLRDANWIPDGSSSLGLTGIDDINIISRLRINLDLDATAGRTGNFVVHFDQISISEGPLTDD